MLAICGDSFGYGTEQNTWPKILADKLNMSLLNLSLVAGSNYSICFQLQHILIEFILTLLLVGTGILNTWMPTLTGSGPRCPACSPANANTTFWVRWLSSTWLYKQWPYTKNDPLFSWPTTTARTTNKRADNDKNFITPRAFNLRPSALFGRYRGG